MGDPHSGILLTKSTQFTFHLTQLSLQQAQILLSWVGCWREVSWSVMD